MREIRSSGSVEGVMRNHDPYSDFRLSSAANRTYVLSIPLLASARHWPK